MPNDVQVPEGLVYVDDRMPGIRRHKSGRGFRFVGPDGLTLKGEMRARCLKLAVPPAYENVWICALPNGHLQATGFDARGRKQYRYHADWALWRSEAKYGHLPEFGEGLGRLRRRVDRDLKGEAGDMTFSLAAMVLLIDRTHLRAGNPSYALENRTFGATTLLARHLSLSDGRVRLKFRAKGGKTVNRTLHDKRLHKIMHVIGDLPGRQLFTWLDDAGVSHPVSSNNLNEYIAEASGVEGASAKTFRTWGGSLAAFTEARAAGDACLSIRSMAEAAAETLANTPSIARKSYIHPKVLELAEMDADVRHEMMQALPTEGDSALRADERRMLGLLRA
ncbi:DNA topoisomerase IB [Falsirhodobacter sp. alg1]|uniref:DNA topoisomerase IB n=1 Tax=Falsirhodobacter sp. alg1 TaxID=1472418 RepID=UPI0005EE2E43|nr:DNA topoisomerase IB [Falsirhodobacter sp. alg1]